MNPTEKVSSESNRGFLASDDREEPGREAALKVQANARKMKM